MIIGEQLQQNCQVMINYLRGNIPHLTLYAASRLGRIPVVAKGARKAVIGGARGDSANVKYYLTRKYVEENWPDEVNANESVLVNDNLPGGWE